MAGAPDPDRYNSKQKNKGAKGTGVSVASWIANLVFFAVVISAALALYMSGALDGGGSPRVIFGFSADIVLSGSMQSEIPQGSLVLVREVDPNGIQIGDDITFLTEGNSLVTHKVVDITEDYQQSGMRGFKTKGVDNPHPDKDTVYEDNVVGKVVFHNLLLGSILSYIQDRIWVPVLAAALLLAFVYALGHMFRTMRDATPSRDPESGRRPAEADGELPTETNNIQAAKAG